MTSSAKLDRMSPPQRVNRKFMVVSLNCRFDSIQARAFAALTTIRNMAQLDPEPRTRLTPREFDGSQHSSSQRSNKLCAGFA
jgi:hypothetical protein